MTKKIVILQGYTSSGKTTVSNYLNQEECFSEFHPYGSHKRYLEKRYNCPNLDTKEGKSFIPDGMSITMQEYMIEDYHFKKRVDPFFTTRILYQDISKLSASTDSICVVSIRNHPEAEELLRWLTDMGNLYNGIETYFIWINRPGYTGETSDEDQKSIWKYYTQSYPNNCYTVNNKSTEQSLCDQVKSIVLPNTEQS